jgi:hypothetical protein
MRPKEVYQDLTRDADDDDDDDDDCCRHRPWDKLITHPRTPAMCVRDKCRNEKDWAFH